MSKGTDGPGRGGGSRRAGGWGGGGFTLFCDQRTECRLEGWKKKKGRSREERESKEPDCIEKRQGRGGE